MAEEYSSSKATQVAANLSTLEQWITEMDLPRGVHLHFAPVKDLLHWLQVRPFTLTTIQEELMFCQCLSSVTEFPNLVATIQQLKMINPLQVG